MRPLDQIGRYAGRCRRKFSRKGRCNPRAIELTPLRELAAKGGVVGLQDGGGLPTLFAIVSLRFVTAFCVVISRCRESGTNLS